jgi:hypothetical protein
VLPAPNNTDGLGGDDEPAHPAAAEAKATVNATKTERRSLFRFLVATPRRHLAPTSKT